MTQQTTTPTAPVTHYAFDYGILEILAPVRTKLTLCDRTVPVSQIDNANPTCPDCQAIHAEADALRAVLADDQIEPGITIF